MIVGSEAVHRAGPVGSQVESGFCFLCKHGVSSKAVSLAPSLDISRERWVAGRHLASALGGLGLGLVPTWHLPQKPQLC